MTTPTFEEFYEAVHGRGPFPWQIRLAEVVLREGWPGLLDLPTGAGKTSALDVALYALAASPKTMPRRTLLVVDRRIVVDQGAEHALKVLRALTKEDAEPAAARIAERLRGLWGGGPGEAPFAIATMRGGMPRDNDWAKRPDQPVLGVSTIDQVGSRLLFRGYGISPKSASIHAGLLGNDTLILLDEVHLATAFAETLHAVRSRYRSTAPGLPDRFAVVQMSATPGGDPALARRFHIEEEDRRHPVLRQRLRAKKPTRLVRLEVRGDNEASKREAVAERVIAEALALQAQGAKVVGVVVNRVDTARLAWRLLAKHTQATERLLVTGRMRPIDRDRLVRERLLTRAGADRTRGDAAMVVVATQCIEAGADLDFDGLVTECASLDALRQRFGRLDRRGEVTEARGAAPGVIVCRSDLAGEREADPIYGEALAATWKWLTERATAEVVGFGIDGLEAPNNDDGTPRVDLLAPVAHAPVLLPAHLDAWAHTTPVLRPSPDPDPALWLHGPQRASNDVQVVWRADLLSDDGTPRPEEALGEDLAAVRPSSLEAMSLPIHVVRAWLSEQTDERGMADVLVEGPAEESRGRDEQRGRPYLLVTRREDPQWQTLAARDHESTADDLRPGDLILVPTSYGGINSDGTFDPDAKAEVVDVGDLAQLRGRGVATLRMAPATLRLWGLSAEIASAVPKVTVEAGDEAESNEELKDRVRKWVERWPERRPERDAGQEFGGFIGKEIEWELARRAFLALRKAPAVMHAGVFIIRQAVDRARLASGDAIADEVSEDDDSSFRAVEITLRRHSGDVRRWTERFAEGLGFSAGLAADLALAAWLHDVGKADPRFQRWLAGGDEVRASMTSEALAKSSLEPGSKQERERARRRSGYPRGYRHEVLSLAMIEHHEAALISATDRDLVLHLVASHHGYCRPHAPALDHPDEVGVSLQHGDLALKANTRHGKALANSGVADRFSRLSERYGWWGLAWLEAVLRLADHRASEEEAEEESPPEVKRTSDSMEARS